MYELIKIEEDVIGEEKVNSVDARELWEFLGVETPFNKWIERRIKHYEFVINTDFYTFVSESTGGRRPVQYIISIDMAKELAMVERNQKGKEARQYFIKCEKIAKEKKSINNQSEQKSTTDVLEDELRRYALMETPKHIAQIESVKQVKTKCGEDLGYLLLTAPAQQNIIEEEVMLEPTELGKHFNLTATSMNKKLMQIGLQVHDGEEWVPTKRGSMISFRNSWTKGTKSGYNLKWYLSKIRELMNKPKRRRRRKRK